MSKTRNQDLLTCTLKQTLDILVSVIKRNLEYGDMEPDPWRERIVPHLYGDPGVGKSAIARQAAHKVGVNFDAIMLTQYDPIIIGGIKFFEEHTRTMYTTKPEWLKEDGRWMILIDEFAQASMMAKNIFGEPLNDHRIGPYHLSPHLTLCLASNSQTSGAGTSPTPSQIRDRTFDLYIRPDLDEWAEAALRHDIRQEVINFLRYRPQYFNLFDPQLDKNSTQRGWTKASEILDLGLPSYLQRVALQGQVGPGPSSDFIGYLEVAAELPSGTSILDNPSKAMVPNPNEKPALAYAVCGMLAAIATQKNIGAIIEYSERLPGDFAMMLMKDALVRDETLRSCRPVTKWLSTRGTGLILS